MKNTNFCAKANMKRDVNRVEPARRVLLKAGAVLLAVLVLFCTACGKRGSGDAIQTNLPQSAAPQTSEPVPQQGGTLKLPMPRNLNKDNLNYNLKEYGKAGLGSLEVTPIYGVKGNESHNIRLFSRALSALTKATDSFRRLPLTGARMKKMQIRGLSTCAKTLNGIRGTY